MKKYVIFKPILIITFLVTTHVISYAQVTIGSGSAPQEGALLQLKETENGEDNSIRGLLYPRVALIKADELFPMYGKPDNVNFSYTTDKATLKKSHIGLVVFNTTDNPAPAQDKDVFTPGLYIWDGSLWKRMDSRLVIAPEIQELKCASATLSPAQYQAGIPYSGTLIIPYIGGNGGEYDSHTISTSNGLTATLQTGALAVGNGSLYYNVAGTPIELSPATTEFVIDDFLGQNCSVIVGDEKEVKVMEYAKLYIYPLPDAPNPELLRPAKTAFSQPIMMGNIKVRYFQRRYYNAIGMAQKEEYIQFAPKGITNVTYSYTKHGSGGVNYAVYGQAFLKADQFISPTGQEWDPASSSLKQITTNVVASNSDAYTINSNNRDFAILTVIFHNTGEIYRISFNINGSISGEGVMQDVEPSLTIFIEKIE